MAGDPYLGGELMEHHVLPGVRPTGAGTAGAGVADGVLVALSLRGRGPSPERFTADGDVRAARDMSKARAAEFHEGRALLRWLLSTTYRQPPDSFVVRTTSTGKPVLDGLPPVGVSISHTDRVRACAIAPGREIGIDIEPVAAPTASLVRRVVPDCADELEAMPAARRARTFTTLWTVREACVKATGQGLTGADDWPAAEPGAVAGSWRGYRWRTLPAFSGCAATVAVSADRLSYPAEVTVLLPAQPGLSSRLPFDPADPGL